MEDKVVISIEKYLEEHDYTKKLENKLNELTSLLLNNTQLNSSKNDLIIDSYNLKYSRILTLIEELKPKEYKEVLEKLKKDED